MSGPVGLRELIDFLAFRALLFSVIILMACAVFFTLTPALVVLDSCRIFFQCLFFVELVEEDVERVAGFDISVE